MTGLPQRFPAEGLPARVEIYEVGPRDGLQNEQTAVPTATKVELIRRLVAAGLRIVEATSFVSPRWVPQLGDAAEVMAALDRVEGVRHPVLVPNERGLERALAAGVDEIAVFASATESFAQRNLNRSVDESLAMFAPVVSGARAAGLRVRGYLSMCFGDPWEGPVPVSRVVDVGTRLLELGCDELALGDTIGTGTPGHVQAVIAALGDAGVGPERLGVHFHDTYGQAIANTVTALEHGVDKMDSSAGGLGGCPYAPGAMGNVATEDLVWLLDGMGIEHGLDGLAVARVAKAFCDAHGLEYQSRAGRALLAAAERG